MLTKVTLTGADDSIPASELLFIAKDYPFVEWGLLLSRNSQGMKRFPSHKMLNEIYDALAGEFTMSGHLCGSYVREILLGNDKFIEKEIPTWGMYERIQINTHGIPHKFELNGLLDIILKNPSKEFIFQYDNTNKDILIAVVQGGPTNVSTLFDLSHGEGLLPASWPDYIPTLKCGYAGGIGPDNIVEQIKKVEEKAGEFETWVDMETRLRSVDDRKFIWDKAVDCLKKAKPFITHKVEEGD